MTDFDWNKIKKIFFVGIKGVGMTPLALIAKDAGFEIMGSDMAEEFITDEVLIRNKIKVVDFSEDRIEEFFGNEDRKNCLVITTGAHSGYANSQVVKAKDLGIKFLNQGQALGIFMSGEVFNKKFEGITVTGSHGKTTISAMVASSLVLAGFDPSYMVGTSIIFPIGPSGHLGKGKYFVAEGDEYVGEVVFDRTPKILYQKPKFAIINNIDFDHPDIYKSIDDIKNVMTDFVNGMEENGTLFVNSDDKNTMDVIDKFRKDIKIITFGERDADYVISNIAENLGSVRFSAGRKNETPQKYTLEIPGIHNAKNALAVIALLDELGISDNAKSDFISKYKGCRRRMELIGKTLSGAQIVDDYGHHPNEIKSTLLALKKFYGKKIICVFQSHTYSRTQKLLKDFTLSFGDVDELILIPIFKSQRDTELDIISHEDFSKPFKKEIRNLYIAESLADAESYLRQKVYDNQYLIVTIGAGDVYKIGYNLIEK